MANVISRQVWAWVCPKCCCINLLSGMPDFHGQTVECDDCNESHVVAPQSAANDAQQANHAICPECKGTGRIRFGICVPMTCDECGGTGKQS